MKRGKTAILIATWKYPQGCLRLLESIKENTQGEYHVIVLNDGTPEGYEGVQKWVKDNIGYFYVCHKENRTVYQNWNYGIRSLLVNEWPVILNDDVQVLPGWLDALWEGMDEKTAWIGFQQYFGAELVSHWIGSCMLINPNMLQEVGLFDEKFQQNAGDVDLEWRAHYAGYSVKATGCYMKHEVSRTMRSDVGMGPREHHRRASLDNRRLAFKHATRWHELEAPCKREIDWRDFHKEMEQNRDKIQEKIFGSVVV